MQTVQFTQMRDGTKAEYDLLHEMERHYIAALPDRILGALRALDDGLGGYRISRLQHSLQAATEPSATGPTAIGWSPRSCTTSAARWHRRTTRSSPPPSSAHTCAEVTWAVLMHGVFQQHYYGHHLGLDPDAREAHRDNEWFAACERFCERWDQASFDPDYPTEALEHFEPMLRDVFGRAAFDPAIVGE